MKKELLLMMAIFMAASSALFAQETVIFYPNFQYDTGKGFTKHNLTIGYKETDLWKRSSKLSKMPTDVQLGYNRNDNATYLSCTGYGKDEGSTYTPTDTYAVVDPVNLSNLPQDQNFKVTFFTQAQYALGNNSEFSVLLTENYTGDPSTTVWTDVTNQLDQIDADVKYDSNWTKSTLNLNPWKTVSSLVLAFRYQVKKGGTVDKTEPDFDRPGAWRVCEVRFTYSDTPTGLISIVSNTPKFYPNPATEYITFKREVKQVELYNLGGKKVNVQLDGNSSLDVSSCSAGVYILKMELENGGAKSAKVIIK
ncbi:MAG: T9SS type A sorting domain-containing protein [Carboxylicivirga sp.]|jgi:hypothetical protein|nr:T9SS type A sorting domain-containing protein [Carboxylicivirga sp.]